ncbi:MAG: type II toxin-antitoxin system Phd/YefM family antitoxin [Gammaproteobacteria bacterium]
MSALQTTVGSYEAKTKLPELLERAASGEEITITKHDQPIAKLVPATRPSHADLEGLFLQMDEIRSRSVLNPPGKEKLTIKQLIDEGRK